jgi:hypothetical protein
MALPLRCPRELWLGFQPLPAECGEHLWRLQCQQKDDRTEPLLVLRPQPCHLEFQIRRPFHSYVHCLARPIASVHEVGTCKTLIRRIARRVFFIDASD